MIVTLATSESIVAVLATAVATTQPTYNYSGVNWSSDGSTSTADYSDGALNGVTEQTVVSAPSSGFKQVDSIRIYNNDIASVVLTVSKAVGASRYPLGQWTVSPGAWVDVLTSTTAQGGANQSENAMTSTGTAVFGSINRVKSLGANATISIPTGATTGQLFDIAIDQSCGSYLVTLQDTGGAYIDYDCVNSLQFYRTSRIMWAGEWATLEWTGSYWHKKAGKTIPMSACIGPSAAQTFSSAANTELQWNTNVACSAPSGMQTLGSYQINILRSGRYRIHAKVATNTTNSSANAVQLTITSANVGTVTSGYFYCVASQTQPVSAEMPDTWLTIGDTLTLYLTYTGGSYTTSVFLWSAGYYIYSNYTVEEIPIW